MFIVREIGMSAGCSAITHKYIQLKPDMEESKNIGENFLVVQHVITVLVKLTVIIFHPVLSQTCTSNSSC